MVTARELSAGASIHNIMVAILAGILLIIGPVVAGCLINLDHGKWSLSYFIKLTLIMDLALIASALLIRVLAVSGLDNINNKWVSLENLSQINGCSDQYTNVPVADLSGEFETGKDFEKYVINFPR